MRLCHMLTTRIKFSGLLVVLLSFLQVLVAPSYVQAAPRFTPFPAQDRAHSEVKIKGASCYGILPVDSTRILFVGNSITFHAPMGIHTGAWGMAASAADKDFVHRVQLQLAALTGIIPEIAIERWDVGWDDTTALARAQQFAPTLIIVQVGDNATDVPHDTYSETLTNFVQAVQGDGRTVVLVGVWYSAERETWSSEVAAKLGIRFVPIRDIGSLTTVAHPNCWDTDPVCSHPGDTGMAVIANRIVGVLSAVPRYYLPWVSEG